MRYLITGGAGFIGSHLAETMLARGDDVLLLDDFSTGRRENVAHLLEDNDGRIELVSGSVVDADLVADAIGRVDVVAHLAASVGVQLIVAKPLETLLNNVRGTEVVLEAAARTGTKVLVTSTSEIYGKNAAGPLREDSDRILGSPLVSRWSYSTSKAVDEIFAHAYWRERGLPTVIVRLFNCAGPRQSPESGMVIPRFVRQALRGEDITVYGDGTQARSFCHVLDTVGGLVALLDEPAAVGDVFNVGAQNETTILGLAELVVEMTGSSSSIRYLSYSDAYEPGFEDMERRLPNIAKIQRVTGWQPVRSLRDIIRDVMSLELKLSESLPIDTA
jgi:nucleoside-diphosphate-sugar epimerase